MARNMGTADRLVRSLLVAPLLVVAAIALGWSSVLGVVLLALAASMLATAAVGYCPLYGLVGLSTGPARRATQA